ncbi:MAG: hypothetical protein Q8O01_02690, partial [Candidatus Omnitrophota bacterium]|nr:hypothetical protein [Candidatus Omnitrophota bacterium]
DCGACCEPVLEIASADFVSLAMTGEAIGTSCLLAMTKMAVLTQSGKRKSIVWIPACLAALGFAERRARPLAFAGMTVY